MRVNPRRSGGAGAVSTNCRNVKVSGSGTGVVAKTVPAPILKELLVAKDFQPVNASAKAGFEENHALESDAAKN
jgi:hypothetical protein